MSESEKEQWWQVFFVLLPTPGLGESPERHAIFTVFSTQTAEPLCGRLRVYLLNSAEQAFEMLAANRQYVRLNHFLPFIEEVVQKGKLPSHNCDSLPKAEMLENTEIGALASIMIWKRAQEEFRAEKEAAAAIEAVEWRGEKPKA